MPPSTGDVRLLQAASATSSFDRFVVGPLLLSIAADLGVRLDVAASVASTYFLAYGLSQPFWGRCSDRIGRVRTMRLTLAGACACGTASTLVDDLLALTVLRGLTGACMAAVVPAGLVYVGDAVPFASRQRTLTDLNAATALGLTAATALGGVLAAAVSWRAAFLVPAVAAGVLALLLSRLPEPARGDAPRRGLAAVLRSRWGLLVLALALVEGAALLGLLTYFAPALESRGVAPDRAGAVVALYGVGLLLASRVVKRLAGRTSAPAFLASGAAGLGVAYALVAASQSGPVVGLAALLLGAAWAAMHSTMQAWATEVVPGARAAAVSLFAGCLFVGSGLATALLAPLAGALRWQPLFAVGVVLALLFGAVATTGRALYGRGPAASVPAGGRAGTGGRAGREPQPGAARAGDTPTQEET